MQDPADYDRLSAALGLDGTTADITLSAVCQSCLGALSVDGAGISLMAGTLSPAETASSDDRARWLDDRQFVLDEGPVIDAFRDGEPTLETDIANTTRWPAFVPHALDRQVSGVFAFPISVGERRVGTLSLYRDEVVDLDD
ncbi:MAG TPA: GAF domain-containing protein, partial [Acidimicrobiia bacterium]|nr:GAF domain-containing protein [Acidimicrobiia bacterium]